MLLGVYIIATGKKHSDLRAEPQYKDISVQVVAMLTAIMGGINLFFGGYACIHGSGW